MSSEGDFVEDDQVQDHSAAAAAAAAASEDGAAPNHANVFDNDAEVSDDGDDSSDEDDDEDDDEEAIQRVREGFIVDDDEEENIRRKHKKRRRREAGDEARAPGSGGDDALDEDDLELLMENSGVRPAARKSQHGKLKRLKRASAADEGDDNNDSGRSNREADVEGADVRQSRRVAGLNDMFSDDASELEIEEDIARDSQAGALSAVGVSDDRNILDEFEDFIEDDEFSDEDEENKRRQAKQKAAQRARKAGPRLDTSKLSSVDRESLQQLFEVFGNGAEYEWALEAQEIEDDGNGENAEPTSLDEVFEHAELKERMLTEEDNVIRIVDVPERYQKYRALLNYIDLDDSEMALEQQWIHKILRRERGMVGANAVTEFDQNFKNAVFKVVEFVSKDNYEVPFIWTHRRDFLLYSEESTGEDGAVQSKVHKLLYEDDLWRIVRLDIEYHSLYEKRLNIERLIEALQLTDDDLVNDIKNLETMVSIQDLHDYINFTYSAELRDLATRRAEERERQRAERGSAGDDDAEEEDPEEDLLGKAKKHFKYAVFERIRGNVLYDAVRAFGISAKEFGENVQDQLSKGFEVPYRIHATDDAVELPQELLEKLCEDEEVLYKDPENALQAVRKTFAEEIFHNPKIRHEVRTTYKDFVLISCAVTEKGRLVIDNHNLQFADLKYAIHRTPADLVSHPDVFLRMLQAELLGLLVIKVETKDYQNWYQCIYNCLLSDGSSDISEQWNKERDLVLQQAFKKLTSMVALNTKEDLRRECERLVQNEVRRHVLHKFDQAPFTPSFFDKGTRPKVLALSFGKGDYQSAVLGCFLRDNGKVEEFFKSESNPIRDRDSEDKFAGQLKEFFDRALHGQMPDVVVVAGFNAVSKRLYDSVRNFVSNNDLRVNTEDIQLAEGTPVPLIPVIWGQDETARLYQNSERAKQEFPDKPPISRYCVSLARYVQNPLLEYVSMGEDILSLTFCDSQKLVSNDHVIDAVETVFVDIVNMVGVEINEALIDPVVARLLPYVAGLGPRKASGLIRNINLKLGGSLIVRSDLIEHELTTATIFINCLSFLNIPFDEGISVRETLQIELLDATRIHPEDYDLARKMAADALDLDEEDMVHVEEQGGIIYQLFQDGAGKVDELNLTAYGKELESKFGKKKYATLQSIKEELVNNYEELRSRFHVLDTPEVFQMLTGETTTTFAKYVLVPVTVNKVVKSTRGFQGNFDDAPARFAKVTTSLLIQGSIEENYIPPNTHLSQGQVVQVCVIDVGYELFTADFSLLPEDLTRAAQPRFSKEVDKWDFEAEQADLQREQAKERAQLSKTRNIQHPLFHNFNHRQAEEYLAPQAVGDCVLRPLLRGIEYLTATWKVHNNLFQHLSIHETLHGGLRQYVVEGKRYDDLDQLIFQHIQAIAKHVDEMCRHPKFREGTLSEVNGWLELYTRANPKNSAYVFCFDHKAPGWFLLLFKVNVNTPVTTWHVKTECDGYRLKGFLYPNMLRLCNGFKQTFKLYVKSVTDKTRGAPRPAPVETYGGYGF